MLSDCQAFKAAYLHGCVKQGLTVDETHTTVKQAIAVLEDPRLEKDAGWLDWVKGNIPGAVELFGLSEGLAKGVGTSIPSLAIGTALGVPIIGGGLAGYGLAKAQGLNDEDPDEIKSQETINALRRAAQRSRLQQSIRKRRESRRPSRPLL